MFHTACLTSKETLQDSQKPSSSTETLPQNPTACGPGQPALVDSALQTGVGLDHLQRHPPVSILLRLASLIALPRHGIVQLE